MKLKNKKTGEIFNTRSIMYPDGIGEFFGGFSSLTELNAEWEDYEEPKKYWFIDAYGNIVQNEITKHYGDEYTDMTDAYENQKQIGDYFDTPEEAEKAVEKLKAITRLKSCGFKFKGWRTADLGADKYYFVITAESDGAGKGDLDLLFGGE